MTQATPAQIAAYELIRYPDKWPDNPTPVDLARARVAHKRVEFDSRRLAAQKGAQTRRENRQLGVRDERREQLDSAKWLDEHVGKLNWMHPPNEGARSPQHGEDLKNQGLKPGAADVIIFATPPRFPWAKGACIELKRADAKDSAVTPSQHEWLEAQRLNRFLVRACFAADELVEQLEIWGW